MIDWLFWTIVVLLVSTNIWLAYHIEKDKNLNDAIRDLLLSFFLALAALVVFAIEPNQYGTGLLTFSLSTLGADIYIFRGAYRRTISRPKAP